MFGLLKRRAARLAREKELEDQRQRLRDAAAAQRGGARIASSSRSSHLANADALSPLNPLSPFNQALQVESLASARVDCAPSVVSSGHDYSSPRSSSCPGSSYESSSSSDYG
ncbi:hypothetical protein, partial [Pseudomonas viridiflava]|uniref:hypothetical protein n=1 Tax=Pseudomonas viridiflava TaxID=33069 RepID=UPI003C6E80C3